MKKTTFLLFVLFLVLTNFCFGQETSDSISHCSMPLMTQEQMEKMPHYGNNNLLLEVLQKHDFVVPEDYFSLDLETREKIQEINIERKMQSAVEAEITGVTGVTTRQGPYYVPLKIWIYQNNEGAESSITEERVDALIAGANRFYWENGMPIIVYKKCEVSYVRHDGYFNLAALGIAADVGAQYMFTAYHDAKAVNIHFVNRSVNGGRAAMIPSKACYVSTTRPNGERRSDLWLRNTLIHEIGHCWGVPHPHDCNGVGGSITTLTNASLGCSLCVQETVDRNALSYTVPCATLPFIRRCEIFGDLLCDTEASSNLSGNVREDCQWNGTVMQGLLPESDRDFLNERWQPQTNNIMSYSRDACISRFTLGQIGVIINTLSNDIGYNFVTTSPPQTTTVTGTRTLCRGTSANYAVQPSNASNYIWNFVQNNPLDENFGALPNSSGNALQIFAPSFVSASRSITALVTPNCCGCATSVFSVTTPNGLSVFGATRPRRYDEYTYSSNAITGATYLWTVPNFWTILSGQGTNSIRVRLGYSSYSGSVSVTTMGGNSTCGTNGSLGVTVTGGSSRLLPQYASELKIYPNPTNGLVRIDIPADFGITKVRLIRLTDYVTLQENTIQGNNTLNISNYPAGIYVIELENAQEVLTYKIVKIN